MQQHLVRMCPDFCLIHCCSEAVPKWYIAAWTAGHWHGHVCMQEVCHFLDNAAPLLCVWRIVFHDVAADKCLEFLQQLPYFLQANKHIMQVALSAPGGAPLHCYLQRTPAAAHLSGTCGCFVALRKDAPQHSAWQADCTITAGYSWWEASEMHASCNAQQSNSLYPL